jgi:hypothetical protein
VCVCVCVFVCVCVCVCVCACVFTTRCSPARRLQGCWAWRAQCALPKKKSQKRKRVQQKKKCSTVTGVLGMARTNVFIYSDIYIYQEQEKRRICSDLGVLMKPYIYIWGEKEKKVYRCWCTHETPQWAHPQQSKSKLCPP